MKRAKEDAIQYSLEEEEDDGGQIVFRRELDANGFAQIPHFLTLDNRISDGAYRTYCLLVKYAQQKLKLWAGRDRLAEERGLSGATISRHFAELTELGLISRQRQMGRKSFTYLEDLEDVSKMQQRMSQKCDVEYIINATTKEEETKEEEVEQGGTAKNAVPPRALTTRQLATNRLEEAFAVATGITAPVRRKSQAKDREGAVRWWNPLGEIYDLMDGDVEMAEDFVRRAVERLREKNLDISAPKSILNTVISLKANPNAGNGNGRVIDLD